MATATVPKAADSVGVRAAEQDEADHGEDDEAHRQDAVAMSVEDLSETGAVRRHSLVSCIGIERDLDPDGGDEQSASTSPGTSPAISRAPTSIRASDPSRTAREDGGMIIASRRWRGSDP